jgi:hypothetical protein
MLLTDKNCNFLHLKIDTLKVDHETHVVPFEMVTQNEGHVTDKKHDDFSLS